jgi:hypothetical protein
MATNIQTSSPVSRFLRALPTLVLLLQSGAHADPYPLSSINRSDYATIEWSELIPQDDLDALLNPPEELANIADGSAADALDSGYVLEMEGLPKTSRYQEALISTNVKSEFNNRKVKIPGFIVPIEYNEDRMVTTFFLVPYFGACIHVPPPPPNQIIYSTYSKGLKMDEIYEPYWLEGILKTSIISNDIATAAYTISVDRATLYDYSEEAQ